MREKELDAILHLLAGLQLEATLSEKVVILQYTTKHKILCFCLCLMRVLCLSDTTVYANNSISHLSFKFQNSVDKRVSMKSSSTVDFSDWLASTDIEFNSDTTGNM